MPANSNNPSDPKLSQGWGPKTIRQLIREGQESLQEPILEWEAPSHYIDPDHFAWTAGALTFILTSYGKIFYGDGSDHDTHGRLIARTNELFERYGLEGNGDFIDSFGYPGQGPSDGSSLSESSSASDSEFDSDDYESSGGSWYSDDEEGWREIACRDDLFGRVNKQKNMVSFWNEDPDLYVKLLIPCLERLIADGRLDPAGKISTPVHNTIPIAEVTAQRAADLTPEQQEKMELYKKLHLMRGAEKQAAMKQLGVGGGGVPHPISRAMDKAGLRVPGQKWWAPNSEGTNPGDMAILTEWENQTKICRWINPDTLFHQDDALTFIYAGWVKDHSPLYTDGSDMAHWRIIADHPELMEACGDIADRDVAEEVGMLVGRLGRWWVGDRYRLLITLWNTNRPSYQYLDDCLHTLELSGYFDNYKGEQGEKLEVVLSTPLHETVPIAAKEETKELSPDDMEEVDLYKQLHLMRGQEKQDAMKKLGVGGQKPHPMQSAMDKAGLRFPGQKWWAPNSEGFEGQLDKVLTEWEGPPQAAKVADYVNPDDLYCQQGSTTFIYTGGGMGLEPIYYGGSSDDAHSDLLAAEPDLRAVIEQYYVPTSELDRRYGISRDWAIALGMLVGRVGFARDSRIYGRCVVTFWNDDQGHFDELLEPCLEQLRQDGLMRHTQAPYSDEYLEPLVSTVLIDTVPWSALEGPQKPQTQEMDDEKREQFELYKQIHNMRGQEKHDAMKKLGVGGQKPHPIQTAMDKAGLRQPGQKWWAMNSEGVEQKSIVDKIASLLVDDPDVLSDAVAE